MPVAFLVVRENTVGGSPAELALPQVIVLVPSLASLLTWWPESLAIVVLSPLHFVPIEVTRVFLCVGSAQVFL
jgi:hypothetical protein